MCTVDHTHQVRATLDAVSVTKTAVEKKKGVEKKKTKYTSTI